MGFWIQGFLIGLASMAPIGMQNLFVINTALVQNWGRLLLTCFIVIAFDILLTCGAFFGIGWVLSVFPLLKTAVLLLGGGVVVYMGIGILRDQPEIKSLATSIPIKKIILMAILVSWGNPQALLDTSLMFGAFRASLPAHGIELFLVGIISATFVWFLGLGIGMKLVAGKISTKVLVWVNRICGTFIGLYGIKLIVEGIQSLL